MWEFMPVGAVSVAVCSYISGGCMAGYGGGSQKAVLLQCACVVDLSQWNKTSVRVFW